MTLLCNLLHKQIHFTVRVSKQITFYGAEFIFRLMACKYISNTHKSNTHHTTTDGEQICCLNESLTHTVHDCRIVTPHHQD